MIFQFNFCSRITGTTFHCRPVQPRILLCFTLLHHRTSSSPHIRLQKYFKQKTCIFMVQNFLIKTQIPMQEHSYDEAVTAPTQKNNENILGDRCDCFYNTVHRFVLKYFSEARILLSFHICLGYNAIPRFTPISTALLEHKRLIKECTICSESKTCNVRSLRCLRNFSPYVSH
jgi:hypothetical protein